MLRMDSTNTNYNASSIVNDTVIANFNAGVNNSGDNVYFSITINTLTDLRTNLATVKTDLEAFLDVIAQ